MKIPSRPIVISTDLSIALQKVCGVRWDRFSSSEKNFLFTFVCFSAERSQEGMETSATDVQVHDKQSSKFPNDNVRCLLREQLEQ